MRAACFELTFIVVGKYAFCLQEIDHKDLCRWICLQLGAAAWSCMRVRQSDHRWKPFVMSFFPPPHQK